MMTPGTVVSLIVFVVVMLGIEVADRAKRKKLRELKQRLEAVRIGNARIQELEDAERERVYESAARALSQQQRMDVPRKSLS